MGARSFSLRGDPGSRPRSCVRGWGWVGLKPFLNGRDECSREGEDEEMPRKRVELEGIADDAGEGIG